MLQGGFGRDVPLPAAGESKPLSALTLYQGADGAQSRWWLGFSSATCRGEDSDNDGTADTFVISVAPDDPVGVEEWIYAEGKGGKIELVDIVLTGTISLPFQVTFRRTGSAY